jgi:hypothetical protein
MLPGGEDPAYRELLAGGATFLRRLEVWQGGKRADGYGDAGVPILDGTLTANLENRVTRRLSLTVPETLFPVRSGDLLNPFQSELVLWCGWRGGGGIPHQWQAFVGPVVAVSVSDRGVGASVTALDRVEQIVEDKFTSAVKSGVGRLVTTAIKDLIGDSQPGAQFAAFAETYATVPDLTWEADRARALDDLASGVGCFWFQLPDGRYTLIPVPWAQSALPAPVATLEWGVGLESSTTTLSRGGVSTVCQVVGESATGAAPVAGVAEDSNPSSPTYYLGPLGRRVLRVQRDTVSSVAQAESLARQMLRQSASRAAQVTTSSLFDPSLELGDVVRIVTKRESFVRALASFTAGFGASPRMSATWRSSGEVDVE